MKENTIKAICLILVLILTLGMCLYFCSQKSGMFIDEIYSYGLSNGYYTPFLTNLRENGIVDETLSRDELLSYIETDETDRFAVGSVYYNQTQDVHPPLYYWLLNFASSLTPNSFSMWTGLILNLIIFGACLIMLWLAAIRLFSSWKLALTAVVLYGLSNAGLSTMLMIRMYCLLTFFTLLLAYWFVRFYQERKKRYYLAIGATILLGMLTQYYFVFYAFFICGAFLLYDLFTKNWKDALSLAAAGLAGIAAFLLIWPAVFTHLTRDALVSGGNAVQNLSDVSGYAQKFWVYGYSTFLGLRTPVKLTLIGGAILLMLIPLWVRRRNEIRIDWMPVLILLPAFAAFVTVVILSPVKVLRYVYNLMPLFVLACIYLFYLILKVVKWQKLAKWAEYALPILCLAWMLLSVTSPSFLGKEHEEYIRSLEAHVDAPCVYFTHNNWIMMTQDLMELVEFDDVFVTDNPRSPALMEYLDTAGQDTVVIYVDTDSYWSSGIDAESTLNEMMSAGGFTKKELLYTLGGSETWVLYRA